MISDLHKKLSEIAGKNAIVLYGSLDQATVFASLENMSFIEIAHVCGHALASFHSFVLQCAEQADKQIGPGSGTAFLMRIMEAQQTRPLDQITIATDGKEGSAQEAAALADAHAANRLQR